MAKWARWVPTTDFHRWLNSWKCASRRSAEGSALWAHSKSPIYSRCHHWWPSLSPFSANWRSTQELIAQSALSVSSLDHTWKLQGIGPPGSKGTQKCEIRRYFKHWSSLELVRVARGSLGFARDAAGKAWYHWENTWVFRTHLGYYYEYRAVARLKTCFIGLITDITIHSTWVRQSWRLYHLRFLLFSTTMI